MGTNSSGRPESIQDGSALKGKTGLRRLMNAARYSFDGVREAWRHEDAFRQEVVFTLILVPVALWLPVVLVQKLLLVGVLVLVLVVELLNSAIEAAIDRDSLEINPLGKRAKDAGSAAVMLAVVMAGATWVAILWTNFGPGPWP